MQLPERADTIVGVEHRLYFTGVRHRLRFWLRANAIFSFAGIINRIKPLLIKFINLLIWPLFIKMGQQPLHASMNASPVFAFKAP